MVALSIITINYNNCNGLRKTMESVGQQDLRNCEVIVIDGGSNDGSLEVIKSNESVITKWISEKDKGIYDAQNKGAEMAKGSHLLFLNSGDWLCNEHVLTEVKSRLRPDVFCFGDAQLYNASGIYAEKIHPTSISSNYLMKETICHQSQFIPRSLFNQLNGYNTDYRIVADYEFLLRAFFIQRVPFHNMNLMISVFDTTGVSSSTGTVSRIAEERKRARRGNAPAHVWMVYETYALLLSSRISKFVGLAALVKMLKEKTTNL